MLAQSLTESPAGPAAGGSLVPVDRPLIRLETAWSPFGTEVVRSGIGAGATIAEIVAGALRTSMRHGVTARVWIDDWLIPEELWHAVRPKPGRTVFVRAVVAAGGGGKNPLRFILQLVVLAAAIIAAPYLAGVIAPAFGGLSAAGMGVLTSVLSAGLAPAGALVMNLRSLPAPR